MTAPVSNLLSVQVDSGDPLDVRKVDISEQISRLFTVSVVAVSPNPDIDLDAVVGLPAAFSVVHGTEASASRTWAGVCVSLQQLAVEADGLSTYQIEIAPFLWFLTQSRRNRIFQRLSELEIVEKVLGEWSIPFDKRIVSEHKKRKYRVQYGESDFAFLSRMLEDAGISFYFDPASTDSKLVICDAPQRNEERPPIRFRDAPMEGDREFVTAVRIGRQVRPGKYTLRDQDYRLPPAYRLMQSGKGGTAPEEGLERYHYVPGSFLVESEKGDGTPSADDKGKYRADDRAGEELAQKRLDAKRVTARTISFNTNCLDLSPGVVTSFFDHPKSEVSAGKRLLLTTMKLSATQGGQWSESCQAVSADVPYYPSLSTSKPKVQGVETATVVGPSGEQIHVDEFGRVRVQFHWDLEGTMDDNASCWIPVSQSWAGGGFGSLNLPRVGHEVIIDFLGGDPDRPVVVGRVYTGSQKVPYSLPAMKTQSGWKSQTVGGMGYNEIMFEDAPGRELVRMQAELDLTKLVKRDESVTIGRDQANVIGRDDALTIGNDRTHTIGNDESIQVGNNQTIVVGVNQSITVGADQSITLPAGNQTESITGNRTFTLVGDLTETIVGDSTLTQTGNQTEVVTGDSTRTQTGNQSVTLLGDRSLVQSGSQMEVQLGGQTSLQLGDRLELQVGGRKDFQLGSRLDIQLGGTTRLEIGALSDTVVGPRSEATTADATETVGAAKKVTSATWTVETGAATLKGGSQLDASASAVKVSGGSINIEAGGETVIKGSIIRLN
ncbi:type VI secretion system Vgr family protein [Chondromyces apiculatus]|uniref:VgrG protein n=1 Tax=Chondromyces apiculatus DSM 436 TaxID=1192034 RepID=A0A017TFS7_9BACT|nr:type VI secretion system tip protein TssI/VgrG [Chondromyces apiculatus]EYF08059.1 VgrG protein [Chondromyces apiculatus DSM 436]